MDILDDVTPAEIMRVRDALRLAQTGEGLRAELRVLGIIRRYSATWLREAIARARDDGLSYRQIGITALMSTVNPSAAARNFVLRGGK